MTLLTIAFIIVTLMLFVSMTYYYSLEHELIKTLGKVEELQTKVNAWVTWSEEETALKSETAPPESV